MVTRAASVLFLPELTSAEEANDQLARAAFYFAHTDFPRFTFIADLPDGYRFEPPDTMDPVVGRLVEALRPRLEILDPGQKRLIARAQARAGLWLQWCRAPERNARWQRSLRLASRRKKLWQVDKETVRHEGSFFIQAGFDHQIDREAQVATSRARFEQLCRRLGPARRAYVIGTGPSAARFGELDFSDGVTIICNTIILDDELLRHVRARVLVFADPIFHFGCSLYAAEFRRRMAAAVTEHDLTVIIPSKYYALFTALLPALEPRTIAVPFVHDAPINMDLRSRFYVKTIDNILTLLMLPVAATLAPEVCILGCDGRPPVGDDYFWRHNPKTQLVDLLANIKRVHPGFFHLDYEDYYEQHCHNTERWITAAEQAGITCRGVMPSFVPALRRRTTPKDPGVVDALGIGKAYRVVSINPDLCDDFGHYLHHDLRVREAVVADGGDFVSLASKALAVRPEDPKIVPTFTHNSWAVARPQGRFFCAAFSRELRAAVGEITAKDPVTPNLFIMYSAAIEHVPLVLEVAHAFEPYRNGFALNLFYAHGDLFGGDRERRRLVAAVLRLTRDLRAVLPVQALADTAALQDEVERVSGERVSLWPVIGTTDFGGLTVAVASSQPVGKPLVVYAPANMQLAKGYDLFARLAERMAQSSEGGAFRFVGRECYRPSTDQQLERYADLLRRHGEVAAGILSGEDYTARFLAADIIALPYREAAFQSRTSAAFIDALTAGKPVVATRQTWAGRLTQELGVGATFGDGDLAGFHTALLAVRADYAAYRDRCARAGAKWRDAHNPEHFVKALRASLLAPSCSPGVAGGPASAALFAAVREAIECDCARARERDELKGARFVRGKARAGQVWLREQVRHPPVWPLRWAASGIKRITPLHRPLKAALEWLTQSGD